MFTLQDCIPFLAAAHIELLTWLSRWWLWWRWSYGDDDDDFSSQTFPCGTWTGWQEPTVCPGHDKRERRERVNECVYLPGGFIVAVSNNNCIHSNSRFSSTRSFFCSCPEWWCSNRAMYTDGTAAFNNNLQQVLGTGSIQRTIVSRHISLHPAYLPSIFSLHSSSFPDWLFRSGFSAWSHNFPTRSSYHPPGSPFHSLINSMYFLCSNVKQFDPDFNLLLLFLLGITWNFLISPDLY